MSKQPEDLAPASALERLSRVTVFLSAFVALAFEAWLGAQEWAPLMQVTALAFVVTLIVGRRSATAAWILVLVAAYIHPAIFIATLGRHLPAYQVIWLAALFGAIVARADGTEWAFPALWKLPLAYWALIIVLVWPVVVARETDFRWSTMAEPHISNSGLGGPPAAVTLLVLNVALTQLLGLLSFDSFFRTFGTADGKRFKRVVIVPLAVSLLLGAGLALYQGLFDISWLSGHHWPSLQRAAGGLVDGDGFGTLAGFWSGTALTLANSSVAGLLMGGAGTAILWGGLWATGSRMALLAGGISMAFTVAYGLRVRRVRRIFLLLLFLACTFGALAARGKIQWSTDSPLRRTLESLPALSCTSLLKFAQTDLFDRDAPYGSASIVMLEQFPITGVGVGGFYQLFPDYAYVLVGVRHQFDNAQSWYRHQLAELGIVGSLGWLWWVCTFGWLLVTRRVDENSQFEAGVVKGALVAIAVVSLVAMPTQLAPITLTVWVFAFWYLSLTKEVPNGLPPARWTRGWVPWLIVWLVAIGFVADTYRIGRTTLRPPYRALFADWTYARGFYDLQNPEGREPFRWTSDNAVFVFPTTAHYLKLTFSVQHPDVAVRPVDVRIWRKDQRIVSVTVQDEMPVTWYVRVPTDHPDHPRMMLETWVSRTWRPSDYGQKDDARELGLKVADWTFVNEPPPGAGIIN